MNDNSPCALDRDFGTFSGMGASALEEGVAQYYEDVIIQQKSQSLQLLNQETDDYNQLVDDYNELKTNYLDLIHRFNNLVDEKNAQKTECNQLKNENEKLRTLLLRMENTANSAKLENEESNESWREIFDAVHISKTQTEIASAQQFTKTNESLTNYVLFTKALYTQRKALVGAIFKTFKPSEENFESLIQEFNNRLSSDDVADLNGGKITYAQAVNSLVMKRAFQNKINIWNATEHLQRFD